MQMLGEMAVAQPDTGSFSTYADRALGRWAGFSIGWLYWWFYILVIPIEAIAAGEVIAGPTSVPSWIPALLVIAALAGSNLLAVRNYGEFEYWFALLKVVAIVAFLVLGVLAVLGVLPGSDTHGVSNLWSHGGFAPQGSMAVIAGLLTAMFSFQGSEIVTIAAAESEEPRKNIKKAVRAVVWRLGLFYIGSILIVVCLVPWNADDLAAGSYQAALDRMNIPGAAWIMDVVLVVAVSSCLNSAVYTASRMMFSLSGRGDAPAAFARTSRRGVPANAVVASTVIGIAAVIANYLLPEVFSYLIASSGAIALMMYMVIALTQYATRRKGAGRPRSGCGRSPTSPSPRSPSSPECWCSWPYCRATGWSCGSPWGSPPCSSRWERRGSAGLVPGATVRQRAPWTRSGLRSRRHDEAGAAQWARACVARGTNSVGRTRRSPAGSTSLAIRRTSRRAA